jgi:hypothetical protein
MSILTASAQSTNHWSHEYYVRDATDCVLLILNHSCLVIPRFFEYQIEFVEYDNNVIWIYLRSFAIAHFLRRSEMS